MQAPRRREKLAVTVTGNQWWWDITYNSADASKTLRTANELHLPVGVPVRIILNSTDVIHSFWVPSLAGKQDLIPGRENDIIIVPTQDRHLPRPVRRILRRRSTPTWRWS